MTTTRQFAILFLVAGIFASGAASAHGVRFGFHFGFPIFAPAWYYPAPAYYYPPPAVVAPSAPVYVERNEHAAAPPPEQYWYYCRDTRTYYPYVQTCASTWERVSPTPPGVR